MAYTKEQIHEIVLEQREFFLSGKTLDINFRKEQLLKLKNALVIHEKEIIEALHTDLGRSETEAYLLDIGPVKAEINEALKNLKKWAKPETHFSGLRSFPSIFTKVYKMPYGVTLIISPFNFPFTLSLGVLLNAIAGGNTAVIKASSKSKACTECLKKIIEKTYLENYITVIDGGHDVADFCLEERFDKIFYTGSPRIGSHVMEYAAKNLTPVALELGGETGNWCVIRKDANLKDAARKIAFFKACNSGQICININQVAVAKEVADKFIEELKNAFRKQLGENAHHNHEYAKIINKAAYDKIAAEAEEYRSHIVYGGFGDPIECKYAPTIIYPIDINDKIVNHEIFGPLLPVVTFEDNQIDRLMSTIATREHGLSLYLFTKNKKWAKQVMQTQQYGGGCVNEVCVHFMTEGVPFNGTGHSGMGSYHGVWGFREFTHPSTVLYGHSHFNLSLREHPYSDKKLRKIKKFLK